MLVINPNECIDCGVCEPECPAEAILPDTESGQEQWLSSMRPIRRSGPTSLTKGEQPADADEHKGDAGQVRQILLVGALAQGAEKLLHRVRPA